jgi:hypothetical protein
VAGVCFERFVIRLRNPCWLAFGVGDPMARPNASHTFGAVPIFFVVDAASRLHTGY